MAEQKEIPLGQLAGIEVTARPSAGVAAVVMAVVLTVVGMIFLDLSLPQALLGGILGTLLHWLSEIVHDLGHAWAARSVGYPMEKIRFWGPLGSTLYPADEPPLPGFIHIRRALGGPAASFGLLLVSVLLFLLVRDMGGLAWGLALFLVLENLLIFSLGALIPLGFNDGGTLVQWWGK